MLGQELVHPFQSQLNELSPMGAAGLRVAPRDIVKEFDGLFEILFSKDLLACVGTVRFRIEEPLGQPVILDRKSLAAVESPRHHRSPLGRLHQLKEVGIPPGHRIEASNHLVERHDPAGSIAENT